MELPNALLGPSSKIKKTRPEISSLCFRIWNFLALILKNLRKPKPLKSFLYFGKWNFSPSSKNKKIHTEKMSYSLMLKISYIFSKESFSYISGNGNPEKILCISGNGTIFNFKKQKPLKNFLYFRKSFPSSNNEKNLFWKNVLSFSKLNLLAPSLKKLIFQERIWKAWNKKVLKYYRFNKLITYL